MRVPEKKWEWIRRELRTKIATGEYPVGSALPTYAQLMDRYSAGKWACQTAVYALREEGLVESHHGVGSVVIGTPDYEPDQVGGGPADALRGLLVGIQAAAEAAQDQLDALNAGPDQGMAEDIDQQIAEVGQGLRPLLTALEAVREPAAPGDGDCLLWEPVVRTALQVRGHTATGVVATGWLDPGHTTIAFAHRATLVDDTIVVDFTARQFDPRLPGRWVTPTAADYCHRLARAAHCAEVTLIPAKDDS